jgi:SAM-dependent methyltransferase
MNDEALKTLWKCEEQAAFSGWDFSRLDGRWRSEPLPWDYKNIVLDALKPSDALLDMGTGGGEFLLGLGHPYGRTCVTEAWEPNVQLCRERLAPLGVGVYQVYDDDALPFDDNAFDIVTNRHESYDPCQVSRVLRTGGLFITQQVGGENNRRLSEALYPGYVPPFPGFKLQAELEKFVRLGFEILRSGEVFPQQRFFDVGAVVYYAKVMEWEYPQFAVDSCFGRLRALQEELDAKGYIGSREHRFLLVVRNGKKPE